MTINIPELTNLYHFCKVIVEEHKEARRHDARGIDQPIYAYNNGVLLYSDCAKFVEVFERDEQFIQDLETIISTFDNELQ